MDANTTAIVVSGIAAVPLTISAYASLLSARRSKQAQVNSLHARRNSAATQRAVDGAALSQNQNATDIQAEILFLTHMFADHLADNVRHNERRGV